DLKVEKVTFDASFGSLGNIDESFDKLYFKKVNYDASETEIDSVTSLSSESVSFSGFTLDIPKGSSNGIYVVVRGDVKSSPTTGTLALRWDNSGATTTNFNVKNSDNNPFIPKQYIIDYNNGHTTTIATTTKGTYNVEFDLELAGINNAKNVLAGTMPLIGRLKFTADNENAIIEDLVIQNLGDATNGTLTALYLYDNAEMSGSPLSSADMAAGVIPKALFENVNIVIPTSGDTYIYIAGSLKAIDYSASPGAGSTGEAEATIALRVPATALNYVTKVVGANTGEILNNPFLPIDKTATSTVYGAVMSNITTDFANATLLNGTAKDIFSFKVTAPSSSNIDPDGDALGIKMTTATFRI
ncbi:MAG: hypothetical protein KAJ48_06750, partial [Elusimicrobiales bacterium]|nr:hypothetical protein [Elusimicrobiales bacterium]